MKGVVIFTGFAEYLEWHERAVRADGAALSRWDRGVEMGVEVELSLYDGKLWKILRCVALYLWCFCGASTKYCHFFISEGIYEIMIITCHSQMPLTDEADDSYGMYA
jgi:hypothetical protein